MFPGRRTVPVPSAKRACDVTGRARGVRIVRRSDLDSVTCAGNPLVALGSACGLPEATGVESGTQRFLLPQWRRLPLAAIFVLICGCQLFEPEPPLSGKRELPTIQAPPDAIVLDIVYVERPVGDALLGPDLWRHVDQVASLETTTRNQLQENGFRVGVVGSRPPDALQSMLGLKAEFVYEPVAEKAKQLVGHQVVVRSGGETEVQVSPFYETCDLKLRDGDEARTRTLENARCIYRVTAERLQDGWAKLDFVPQVQHGGQRLRREAGDAGWQFTSSPRAETFHAQRFSVQLNVGEMAVISAADGTPDSLGRLFFLGPDETADIQRLLVIRLSGMRNSDNPYPP